MKIVNCFLLAVLLTCGITFGAEENVGEVVKVFTKENPKPTVEAKLGDLVVFSVQGGTYPGGMIKNLKVEIKGDSLTKVGVWVVPVVTPTGERAVGGIDMSAFLKTAKLGESIVTITPQGDLTKELAKPMKFTVKVTKPEANE
jgi:hypothetical protein